MIPGSSEMWILTRNFVIMTCSADAGNFFRLSVCFLSLYRCCCEVFVVTCIWNRVCNKVNDLALCNLREWFCSYTYLHTNENPCLKNFWSLQKHQILCIIRISTCRCKNKTNYYISESSKINVGMTKMDIKIIHMYLLMEGGCAVLLVQDWN